MLPLLHSTQTRCRLVPLSSVQQVTNTLLPTTMGLDMPPPGRASFHLRFFLSPQVVGTLSSLTASPSGPRKRGQSALATRPARMNENSSSQDVRTSCIVSLPDMNGS